MGKQLFKLVLMSLVCITMTSFVKKQKGEANLTVQFDNIRNKEGKIYIFLYNYENQYPDNPYLHFEIDKNSVSNSGTLKFTIPDNLNLGEYAVSILDDENENDDLDLFLGLPTEGYGFSNNVVPFLSMPDYEDLLFNLSTTEKTIFLTLQYLL